MIEGHIIFNAILYSIVIAYILYINFSAYYQTGTGFLKALVNLFQNWIFRTVYLLIVGFFALDLFPYGGFVLAILLTIAFLNTNMLVYKKDVEESMGNKSDEKNKTSTGTTNPQTTVGMPTTYPSPPTVASTPTYPSPPTGGAMPPVGASMPPAGASIPPAGASMTQTYPPPPTGATTQSYPPPAGATTQTYPPPPTGAPASTPQYNLQ